LMFFHGIYVCAKFRPHLRKQYWLLSMLISVSACVAGGAIASYLICKPPSWLSSNSVLPLFIFAWYLVNFSPADIVFKAWNFVPIKLVITAIHVIVKCRSVFHGVALAEEHLPGSIVGALILGSISGFGGVVIGNIMMKLLVDPNHPSEFSKPTWASKSSFFACLVFYIATDPSHLFWTKAPEQHMVKLVLMGYLMLHQVVTEITGEWTPFPVRVIEGVFYFITRIPESGKVSHADELKEQPKFVNSQGEDSENTSSKKKKKNKANKDD